MPASRKRNRSGRKPPPAQSKTRPAPRVASSSHSSASAPELVDPRWLFKALGLVFAVALLLSYGALCLLYYQGQWQLVLHPSRAVSTTPASLNLQFTELHFAVDATGVPQLSGWWIPAANPSASTISALMLHGADGSIADALGSAATLHSAGLNVLLFDYRGYGKSIGQHPTQDSMLSDASAALNFLINTQHVAPQQVVLYGHGIGASPATQLAAQHHEIGALILDAPDGDLLDRAAHDARSRLVPAHLLFNQTFPVSAPLHTLTTPKLLISYGHSAPAALANAADPKVMLELPSSRDPMLVPAIQRFLDEYVHTH